MRAGTGSMLICEASSLGTLSHFLAGPDSHDELAGTP
jgi:hypothetical protein